MFTMGSINVIKKRSIIAINNTNEALAMPPLDKLPVIMYKDAISGEKDSIMLQSELIYTVTELPILLHNLNVVIDIHSDVAKDTALFTEFDENELHKE